MERINFREAADLGKMLQKTAGFVRSNLLGIFKVSILFLAVPFLIGAFITAKGFAGMQSMLATDLDPANAPYVMWQSMSSLLPGYFFMGIALVLFYIVCLSYIKHYVNGVENITLATVLPDVKKHFLAVFFGGLLVGILCYLGAILCLIPGIYLGVVFSHLFAILIVEEEGFGKAFSKSFRLIKGQWWNSFLLFFVSSLIIAGISFIVALPTYIIMAISMFKNVEANTPEGMFESMSKMAWLVPVYLVVYFINMVITATVQAANYYNLVERQEGIGERSVIDSVGN